VIQKQTIKSYVIVAIGIVECLLFHLNKAAGGRENKLVAIITRIQEQGLLGRARAPYDDLTRFRKLRNRVHIYELRDELGTDYENFGRREFNEVRMVLFDLFNARALALPPDKRGTLLFLKNNVWSEGQ
jgi:hypothetical protein